jgi:hypothetical protein
MSFAFNHSILVNASSDGAFDVFADSRGFQEIMVSSSIITRDCTIVAHDSDQEAATTFGSVCTAEELARIADCFQRTDTRSRWTSELIGNIAVTTTHFKLNEEIVYLGFKKLIPVTGVHYIPCEREGAPLCQVEHRKTDDGLVTTRKTRLFLAHSDSPKQCEVWEDLAGKTAWYLKYFVEPEACKSHAAVVQYYASHFDKLEHKRQDKATVTTSA